jgi:hypothetical protein
LFEGGAPVEIADHPFSADLAHIIEALNAFTLVTDTFTRDGTFESFIKGYVHRLSSFTEVHRALSPIVICVARIGF